MGVDQVRDIGVFDDRWTLRFVRRFSAGIDRVWRAVSSDELNIWLYPVSRVDLRLGGTARFTWGQPEDAAQNFKITKLDPPRLIRFASTDRGGRVDHVGFIQFELQADGDGTLFTFIQRLRPSESQVAGDATDATLPGGTDTAWRPGMLAGFHLNMAALGAWVRTTLDPATLAAEITRRIDLTNDGRYVDIQSADELAYAEGSPSWNELVEVYFDYVELYLPARNGRRPKDPATYPGLTADLAARRGGGR